MKASELELKIGDVVEHKVFGEGTVSELFINDNNGMPFAVEVHFEKDKVSRRFAIELLMLKLIKSFTQEQQSNDHDKNFWQ